ncbi:MULTISPECIES: lipocalin family protein [unclassified Pseudoalteromonas]|uniref:lipocalin family protein n=1 Tax=Pseudoalteromonas TaxID=53246 RepID=UPI00140D5BF6|nr:MULTISPECIES: lipocalin family protein [unclassified Pseudoalteromonas]MCH2089187.1 lipocalin family protein [Pseudoalteromonas sp.]NHH87630.1 Outer membrane lipoprotein Blc [Pseudoalteromonas sp. MB47]
MQTSLKLIGVLCITVILSACTGVPDNIKPVDNFELNRYTGTWYEIARLDHSFERGLEGITAEYSINPDGSVKVINKGYSAEDKEWQQAEGKAKFAEQQNIGHLEVSFFGPFYSSYVVFELDKQNYQYAYITGYNKEYLWFLSRTPTVTKQQMQDFINTAKEYGFKTDELIYVDHNSL